MCLPSVAVFADEQEENKQASACICESKCAEDTVNGNCTVCSAADADLSQCKGQEQVTGKEPLSETKTVNSYESLTQAIAAAEKATTIQLTENITDYNQTIEIPADKNITLDLNGHTISCAADATFSAITVKGILTLVDTSEDGKGTITGGQGGGTGSSQEPNFGGSVYVSSNATFNMEGGHISGNKSKGNYYSDLRGGCGVYVQWEGTFNLSGGYIENNTLNLNDFYPFGGAGVLVHGGTFNMTGGTIQGNAIERKKSNGFYQQVNEFGAGVLIMSVSINGITYSATFNMSGGEIKNNRITESNGSGAGVAVGTRYNSKDSSIFNMSGGEISNNRIDAFGSNTCGGGVFCTGTMNISGSAVISENTATSTNSEGDGGGVYCTPYAVLNMSGGEITGNIATRKNSPSSGDGGGIYISGDNSSSTGAPKQYAFFTMSGGKITNNIAGGSGGGVYFLSYAQGSAFGAEPKPYNFIITGGEITGNTASKMAGGIYYNGDLLQRTGGKLCNNTAGTDGDDIVINANTYPQNIKLGDVGKDWISTCGHSIDGWYIDGDGNSQTPTERWNATVTDGTNTSYCRLDSNTQYVKPYSGIWQHEICAIKAAHCNLTKYTLSFNSNVSDDSVDNLPNGQSVEANTSTVIPSQVPKRDGYRFIEWNTQADGMGKLYQPGNTIQLTQNTTLYAQWEKIESISIQPANVTIYMGGDGYEGTVDKAGNLVTDSEQIKENGFPEPGFLITLPDSLENLNPEKLYLQYKDGDNTHQWKFEKYGEGDHNVYRIVPYGDTETRSVRMQFTRTLDDEQTETVTNDNFDVAKYINETLTMKVYGEGIESDKVHFVYDSNNNGIDNGDKTYDIAIQDGTLTVRGTTSAVQTVPVNKEESFTATKDQPGITAPEGTTYTINGSDVKVKDTTGISLLFDNIIDSNAGDENATYTDLLKAKVDENLGDADDKRQYEYKYLDLVDTHNGNAWVAADKAVTVYWPLPEGADADADFTLLHFQDLHRSMSPTDITNKLTDDNYTPEKIEGTVEGNHIVFKVQPYNNGSGGFSPYVLVWEDESGNGGDSGENTPSTPVTPPDGDDTPDLNTKDHYSYVVGYEDGMVKPEKAITRAEVATIFYRLLKDDVRAKYWTKSNNFTDVAANDWYNTTVSTLNAMGIVTGYEDGSFKPNAPITRAEFAAMAVRFFEEDSAIYEEGTFNDIAGSEWFADAVQAAKDHGIIGGYPDGSFQPNKNISRAEACSIVNRTLDRIPDEDHLLPVDDMRNWPDNLAGAWYYADMQEATNGHEYEWITDNGKTVENWTGDREEIDWAKVEEELEAMHGGQTIK